eukprot:jgi/Chlat1/4523/Chrsp29S04447
MRVPSWTSHNVRRNAAGVPAFDPNAPVYYKVDVGVVSPAGYLTTRPLRQLLPRNRVPDPPPKRSLQRVNAHNELIEERRRQLQEWMWTLLSDILIARCPPMASFLELEAAASAAAQAAQEQATSTQPLPETPPSHDNSIRSAASEEPSDRSASEVPATSAFKGPEDELNGRHARSHSDSSQASLASSAAVQDTPQSSGADIVNGHVNWDAWPSGTFALPMDQRAQARKLLAQLHRRAVLAKSDLEEALSRLEQETAARLSLQAQVKSLQEGLERYKEDTRNAIAQAIEEEQERANRLSWELEEAESRARQAETALEDERTLRRDTDSQACLSLFLSNLHDTKQLASVDETLKEQILQLQSQVQALEVANKDEKAKSKVLKRAYKSLQKDHEAEVKAREKMAADMKGMRQQVDTSGGQAVG